MRGWLPRKVATFGDGRAFLGVSLGGCENAIKFFDGKKATEFPMGRGNWEVVMKEKETVTKFFDGMEMLMDGKTKLFKELANHNAFDHLV
ncbi:hypothetical protein L1987_29675 [Smallanthus sonchifolius]|uniref:Uncharacterized protein n=1 Tax=Smallanthus sonchifolius TaxID=185202 RepID=A0ACB9I3C3_9ASTR|nr:hypothetical protein L1987_29675 [Smallanthus sonchifolius]